MGIDNTHIFNHNIAYTNSKELFAQLEQRLGYSVVNLVYNKNNECAIDLPKAFDGIVICTDDGLTVDDYIKRNELLEFSRISTGNDNGGFYINSNVVENSLAEVNLLRWQQTAEMCTLIKEYGLTTFDYYCENKADISVGISGGVYLLEERKKMYPHIAKFGSTAMLTFCNDHHPEFLEHIANNWTFDDFVSWGKKEFIYIDFKDLQLFDFPEKKPAYYNVFIYDDFSDLKPSLI